MRQKLSKPEFLSLWGVTQKPIAAAPATGICMNNFGVPSTDQNPSYRSPLNQPQILAPDDTIQNSRRPFQECWTIMLPAMAPFHSGFAPKRVNHTEEC